MVAADVGTKLTVKVTGSKSGYTTASKTSKATKAVAKGTLKKGTVKVTGKAKVGKTLTAKKAGWSSGVTYSYQWYANSRKIDGATTSKYKVGKSVKSKRITVKVTAKKAGYASASKTSKKVKVKK